MTEVAQGVSHLDPSSACRFSNRPLARVYIHSRTQMHTSAETTHNSSVTAQEEAGSSRRPNDTMITLRYVDSTEGALPRPHWVIKDRRKPKYDALKGLRGRRPQVGHIPRSMREPSDAITNTRTNAEDHTENTMEGQSADQIARKSEIQKAPNKLIEAPRSTSVGNASEESSELDLHTTVAISNAKSSTSKKSHLPAVSSPLTYLMTVITEDRDLSLDHAIVSDNTLDSVDSVSGDPTQEREKEVLVSHRDLDGQINISIEDTSDEGLLSDSGDESKAASSRSSSDSPPQSRNAPAISATPVFGRRAGRLARSQARQAKLAELTNGGPISVSAEADRIAERREDPEFDINVAIAASNRSRGLGPKKRPRNEDDEGEDSSDSLSDSEESGQSSASRTPKPNANRKRQKRDDEDEDYTPGQKRKRDSTTVPAINTKRVKFLPSVPVHQASRTEDLAMVVLPDQKSKKDSTTVTVFKNVKFPPSILAHELSRTEDSALATSSAATPSSSLSASPQPLPALATRLTFKKITRKEAKKPPPNAMKPWNCEQCDKNFVRQEHLKRHIKSLHTVEKPYACPREDCGKKFSRSDNLTQHLATHTKGQTSRARTPAVSGPKTPVSLQETLTADESRAAQEARIAANHKHLAKQGKL